MTPSLEELYDQLIAELRARKPNDRSERDRYWAIAITELEKAKAVFMQLAYKASA